MSSQNTDVVRTSKVLNSALWNIIGRLAPIAVTLMAIPPLIATLGTARWGIMTIALTLVGTFGIFDLGLGRALTRAIAENITAGRTEESADITITGVLTLGGLGVLAAMVAAGLTGLYVDHGLKISPDLRTETRDAIWILCATAPLVLVNAALWGVISAYHKFRAANLLNIPINILYYLGPLLLLQVWNSLCAVMIALAACRLAMTIGYAVIALQVMPELKKAQFRGSLLIPLWKIGGWMTVSNLTFPILTYCDRFLVGVMVPASFIAYYTTPLDVVGRFSIITLAVTGSAFPALARSWRVDTENTRDVFLHSSLAILGTLFPVCLFTALMSTQLLTLWLGADFAQHSAFIASLLCCGLLFSGLDTMSAGLLDAIGRPDVNAKFSLLELIIYLPVLGTALHFFGLSGAAIAWLIRSILDCLLRFHVASIFYPAIKQVVIKLEYLMLAAFLIFGSIFLHFSVIESAILAAIEIAVFEMLIFYGFLRNKFNFSEIFRKKILNK